MWSENALTGLFISYYVKTKKKSDVLVNWSRVFAQEPFWNTRNERKSENYWFVQVSQRSFLSNCRLHITFQLHSCTDKTNHTQSDGFSLQQIEFIKWKYVYLNFWSSNIFEADKWSDQETGPGTRKRGST